MSATEKSIFKQLATADPKLDKIRAMWKQSATDRQQYEGPIAAELDYYFNTAMGEIGALVHHLTQQPSRPECEIKATAERIDSMKDLCACIGNYLLKHLL
jgi:hypothetical protein